MKNTTMKSARQNYSSGSPWEDEVGYSRAVKIGTVIEVSGTVAIDDENNLVGKNDPYLQSAFILQKIGKVLEQCGSSLEDVIRTRIFVKDISQWRAVGKAHGEVFKSIKPATSMIEIKGLIDPEYLVEIEATAICSVEGTRNVD